MLQQRLQHQHPERRLQQQQQRLDELQGRLRLALRQKLVDAGRRLERADHRLHQQSPRARLREARQRLRQQQQLLQQCVQQRLEQLRHRHGLLLTRLDAISPLATLARGYSITQDAQGQVLKSVTQTAPGQRLTTRLGDGELQVEVMQVLRMPY